MTKIEICNHALLKIGADTIASLDINQNDQEAVVQSAKLCNIFFNQALEEVLRTYRWNSALKRAELTAFGLLMYTTIRKPTMIAQNGW
jgi:hypothetical protein